MMWWGLGAAGALLVLLALYLGWDYHRARKLRESRRPLYCWTPSGDNPFDPNAMRFYTTRPPKGIRQLTEEEEARLIEDLDGE